MPWFYFNNMDNSQAYRSDNGRLAPSEMEKLGDVTEVFQENLPVLPQGCEDEVDDVYLLDDGSIGIKDDTVRHGTKRHIRKSIDYLQMYAPLDEMDRPADYDAHLGALAPYVPQEVLDRMLDDDIISHEEKQELLARCNAL